MSLAHHPESVAKLLDSLQCHYDHLVLTPSTSLPHRDPDPAKPCHNQQILCCDLRESDMKSFLGAGHIYFQPQEMCRSPCDDQMCYIFITYISPITLKPEGKRGTLQFGLKEDLYMKGATVAMWMGPGELQGAGGTQGQQQSCLLLFPFQAQECYWSLKEGLGKMSARPGAGTSC